MDIKLLIMVVLCAVFQEGKLEPEQAPTVNNATGDKKWPRVRSAVVGNNDQYLERLMALEKKFNRPRKMTARRRVISKPDNLNTQQEMMAHALIDSLNDAFKEGESKDGPEENKDIRKLPPISGGTEAVVDEGIERGFEQEGPLRDPFPAMRMPRKVVGVQEDERYDPNSYKRSLDDFSDDIDYKESQPFMPRKVIDLDKYDQTRMSRKTQAGNEEDEDTGLSDGLFNGDDVVQSQPMGPPFSHTPRKSPYNMHLNSFKVRRRKSPEIPVHCIRLAASTIECTHGNFSYSLTLPNTLITQESVENLVSALCSIIENEESPGGVIALNVRENTKLRKPQSYFDFGIKREQL